MEIKVIVANIPGRTVKSKTGKTFAIAARTETFRSDEQGRWTLDGAGAILEFSIPEAGVFPFVDHDKLAYLPLGLSLAFATEGVAGAAH